MAKASKGRFEERIALQAMVASIKMAASLSPNAGSEKSANPDLKTLSVHIGIGMGSLHIFHVGGYSGHYEYVVSGDVIGSASDALETAGVGDVVCDEPTFQALSGNPKKIAIVYEKRKRDNRPFYKVVKIGGEVGHLARTRRDRFRWDHRLTHQNLGPVHFAATAFVHTPLVGSLGGPGSNSRMFDFVASNQKITVAFYNLGENSKCRDENCGGVADRSLME